MICAGAQTFDGRQRQPVSNRRRSNCSLSFIIYFLFSRNIHITQENWILVARIYSSAVFCFSYNSSNFQKNPQEHHETNTQTHSTPQGENIWWNKNIRWRRNTEMIKKIAPKIDGCLYYYFLSFARCRSSCSDVFLLQSTLAVAQKRGQRHVRIPQRNAYERFHFSFKSSM